VSRSTTSSPGANERPARGERRPSDARGPASPSSTSRRTGGQTCRNTCAEIDHQRNYQSANGARGAHQQVEHGRGHELPASGTERRRRRLAARRPQVVAPRPDEAVVVQPRTSRELVCPVRRLRGCRFAPPTSSSA
jgi:hypothetical protein